MPNLQTQQWYAKVKLLASYEADSTTNLPNRSGSSVTQYGLQAGQVCSVGAELYECYDPTAGSAVWFKLFAPKDPSGFDRIQVVSTASDTIRADVDIVYVTYATAACTLTLPSVLAGAPPGWKCVIEKANTGAFKIVVTPDTGASINAAAANATQDMVTGNATASTTVSAPATNDVTAVFRRSGLLTWRSGAC